MDHKSAQYMEDFSFEPKQRTGQNSSKTSSKTVIIKTFKDTPEPSCRSLKVDLQTLRISEESERKLYETLKFIRGPSYRLAAASEYENKNTNLGKQYWLQRGNLVIKSCVDYSQTDKAVLSNEQITKNFAISKLQTYNFEVPHCTEALKYTEGDFSKALELLFCKYYGYENLPKSSNLNELNLDELVQIREEEKEALESIYGDIFKESIKNQVWTVTMKLNYLIETEEEKVLKNKPKVPLKDICKLYLAGKCRYGIKCRFIHRQPAAKEEEKPKEDPTFILEIRFPENSKYPYEAPHIYFYKPNNGKYFSINCLRIVRRLLNEALTFCDNGTPSIYNIIALLENEEEIKTFLNENKEHFLDKDDPLFPQESEDIDSSQKLRNKKSHNTRKNANQFSSEEIIKQDLDIKTQFLDKQRSSQYQKMKKVRKQLPAWNKMNEVLNTIKENQVTIISGETGCGKSTQIPQFILDDWIINLSKDCMEHAEIVCTQPRRLSAIGVAERVASERDENVGNTIGYQIRLENKMSKNTRLTFCTTGILLQRLSGDPQLKSVTHIIVDEVHERSAESDFLLMLLKKLLVKKPNLKIILMSATLKSDVFSSYFGQVPIINIPGRTFPVQQIFLEDILELTNYVIEENSTFTRKIKGSWERHLIDLHTAQQQSSSLPKETILDENLSLAQLTGRYSEYSENTLKSLYLMDHEKINFELIEHVLEWIVNGEHAYPRTGTILIFLPGIAEIMTLKDTLRNNRTFSPARGKFMIVPLHSTLSSDEQSLIFKKPEQGVRKIVLSTNIAETSITIDDCVFVIDTGKMKETRFNTNQNMESLEMCWVSRANAMQRMGRAGRVMPGVCIDLYSSFRFKYHFLAQPIPEIKRIALEPLLLRIRILHKDPLLDLYETFDKMIEPPTRESIATAIQRLQDVGAFDPECILTPLGHHLAALPVDVRIGKLILYGAIFCCVDSALTIAACLSHKSPFISPYDKRNEVAAKKKEYLTSNSDQLTTLKAYRKWMEIHKKHGFRAGQVFADNNFLSIRVLQTLADIKHQFLDLLASIGFASIEKRRHVMGQDRVIEYTGDELNENNESYKLLQGLLCAALYPNVVKILTPEKSFVIQSTGAIPKQSRADELRFKTKNDGMVNLHPSSVNYTIGHYSSPYLVYQEKIKTSKIFIREVTMVSILSLVLFSGYGIDIELHNGTFIISLEDGWIMFAVESERTAQLLQHARVELVKLLEQKMQDPLMNIVAHPNGRKIIRTIVEIVTRE
ncbi:hypothetical protein TKK_0005184 [Trichogramma kaykai]|uniref:RNA helicase n=1 Tax=Trichogramma kaykai TaxID=54128 RepID=A0ABD2XJN0_9HYME